VLESASVLGAGLGGTSEEFKVGTASRGVDDPGPSDVAPHTARHHRRSHARYQRVER
jgi:hypothetical protein